MNTIAHSDCNEVYTNRDTEALPNGINNQTQLCAGTKIGERDACRVGSDQSHLKFCSFNHYRY